MRPPPPVNESADPSLSRLVRPQRQRLRYRQTRREDEFRSTRSFLKRILGTHKATLRQCPRRVNQCPSLRHERLLRGPNVVVFYPSDTNHDCAYSTPATRSKRERLRAHRHQSDIEKLWQLVRVDDAVPVEQARGADVARLARRRRRSRPRGDVRAGSLELRMPDDATGGRRRYLALLGVLALVVDPATTTPCRRRPCRTAGRAECRRQRAGCSLAFGAGVRARSDAAAMADAQVVAS
jgi:hypothetical protein